MLKTKSVYSPVTENDGLRILATRFRGRGMATNLYDVWMPSLGPSEQLLKAVPGRHGHVGGVHARFQEGDVPRRAGRFT